MSLYKLSNQIFTLGLDAQEMSVYAYLCSLPSLQDMLDGAATVYVKQSTIAANCGIRATQTVSKIIARLTDKGLVEPVKRAVKANRHKGTYTYAVKHLPLDGGYFFVERKVFGKLTPRQMLIYLFLCKSYSTKLNICWNSYTDIAEQTGMKREQIIRTVQELIELHLIVRSRRKARENNRVFIDNHYLIIFFVRGYIKREVRLFRKNNRTRDLHRGRPTQQLQHTTFSWKCQEVFANFFLCRGSPSD